MLDRVLLFCKRLPSAFRGRSRVVASLEYEQARIAASKLSSRESSEFKEQDSMNKADSRGVTNNEGEICIYNQTPIIDTKHMYYCIVSLP
jgi:hypothetical protein